MAGVMGANELFPFVKSSKTIANLDELMPNGVYTFSLPEGDVNAVSLGYRYGQVSYFLNDKHWGSCQIVSINFAFGDGDRFYIRRYNTSGTWNNWRRFDNFGYNSLAELANGVADTLDLKIQRKTIPSLTGNTTIEIPDMYASYLVAITYSGQSSLFFVSSWGSIAVFAPIVNNLSGITLTGSVGTTNLVLSTSGSTYNSVMYCLIRI